MWQKEMMVAKEAATAAGTILNHLIGRVRYDTKKSDIDLVTEADYQSEKAIITCIQKTFPTDNVLAEESGRLKEAASGRTWIIDPLDGTTNFVHRFPFFAVSIGLEVENTMVLGVVYNPVLNELFEAAEGTGAFLNQRPIQVSGSRDLSASLLATGFSYQIAKDPDPVLALFKEMLVRAEGVRRPGSAAIDMCYVAAGRFDGFWEQNLSPWDTAAGTIIVQEAGGKVSTYAGEPYTPYLNSVVAANPHIHDEMVTVLGGR